MEEASGLGRLPEHRTLLVRAVDHFRDDDRVVGMVLGGSLGRGGGDFYSDVDLYVVVRDRAFDDVFGEREAAAEALGEPLFRFVADHLPGGDQDYYVVYPGPVKFDFMYYRVSEMEPAPKWAGRPVLKDTTGLVADVLALSASPAPNPPTGVVLLDLDQKFWTWCWYAFAKIMRGELWEAVNGVNSIRKDALLPMLAWRDGYRPEDHRRLEEKLDPESLSRLKDTVAPPDAEALYGALRLAIDLYRELRATVFPRCGVDFDPAPEKNLLDRIESLWYGR